MKRTTAQVALEKGNDRQGNIRRALELIAEEIDLKGRRPVIKVNFVSAFVPLCATHVDATRAVVKVLRDRGEKDIAIAEGAAWGTSQRGFREYGYLELASEYDLELIDLNDVDSWKVVCVLHPDRKPHPVKLSPTMADPDNYIISLTRLKTHVQVGVTLTAKNVIMGVDFEDVRYLNYFWDQGIGEGDLSKIQVIGETIEGCRRTYRMAPRFLRDRRQESKGQLQNLAVYVE